MKQNDFINGVLLILKQRTSYASGGFGASVGNFPDQLERYCKNSPDLASLLRKRAATPPLFVFDCVGVVKSALWHFTGEPSRVYGGAVYKADNVPDFGTNIIDKCSDVSTDFSRIQIGELLWLSGHVGVYIGNGYAIECTTAWDCNVQKTVVLNIRKAQSGEHGRTWTKHGKLPYVEYEPEKPVITCPCCGARFEYIGK